MKKFWMIIGEHSGSTQCRHLTRKDAEKEVERLCRCNPNNRFILLESISVHASQPPPVVSEPITEEMTVDEVEKEKADEIPF